MFSNNPSVPSRRSIVGLGVITRPECPSDPRHRAAGIADGDKHPVVDGPSRPSSACGVACGCAYGGVCEDGPSGETPRQGGFDPSSPVVTDDRG